jgi:metal-sulfur cluster biosynthetic enzyme
MFDIIIAIFILGLVHNVSWDKRYATVNTRQTSTKPRESGLLSGWQMEYKER